MKTYGEAAKFYLVFHGGSGSTEEEIHEALDYGVVKMNVDTDMQYAFTRAVGVSQPDSDCSKAVYIR